MPAQFRLIHAKDSFQSLESARDDVVMIKTGELAGITSGGPPGEHGKRQGMAGPPGRELFIVSEQEAEIFEALLPKLLLKAKHHPDDRAHLQAREGILFLRQLGREADCT